MQISEPFCFEKIATDLSKSDLHPPLYFWILHLFVLLLGVHPYTGILLNLLLQLFSIIPLFLLAKKILKQEQKAAFTVLLWTISSATISIPFTARPYELLSLEHILFALFFYQWLHNGRKMYLAGIGIILAAGVLTHYTFIYVAAGYGIYTLFHVKKLGWKKVFSFALTGMAGLMLLPLLHPHFADSFALQQERTQSFSWSEWPSRAGKVVLAYIQFYAPALSLKFILLQLPKKMILLLFAVGSVLTGCILWFFRKWWRECFEQLRNQEDFLFTGFFFAWITLVSVGPFLLFLTPFHAMGGQYQVCLYPYFALLTTLLLYSFVPKNLFRIGFCVLMGVSSSFLIFGQVQLQSWYAYLVRDVQENPLIVVNATDRRAFPRLIPYLQPGQQILMDENATYKNDSLMQELFFHHQPFLMITTPEGRYARMSRWYAPKCHMYYDFRDGVILETRVFNVQPFSLPLPSKSK
jgi:4-amino-4-deoxy-L-arabinose transferase-like glycosyltransferase